MPAPTAADLAAFIGPNHPPTSSQSTSVIGVVTSMASAYTRGVGFTDGVPNSDISSVILTAGARLLSHARQVSVSETQGPESAQYAAAPFEWSVAELMTLNRYRAMAM